MLINLYYYSYITCLVELFNSLIPCVMYILIKFLIECCITCTIVFCSSLNYSSSFFLLKRSI